MRLKPSQNLLFNYNRGHGAVPNVAIAPEVDTSMFPCVEQPRDSVTVTAGGKVGTGTSRLRLVTGHAGHRRGPWESTAPSARVSLLVHIPGQGRPCPPIARTHTTPCEASHRPYAVQLHTCKPCARAATVPSLHTHAPVQGQPCSQVANTNLCVQAVSLSNIYTPRARPTLSLGCTHTPVQSQPCP